ncbi:hypothetical protein ACIPRL_08120 [Streptomyces sp. NPDC090085]|uniref:hypothetical protein n=1 Tax=Streptomyces sp. NPDC090085 TaxID=3365943 RepID=UPI0038301EDD
MSSTQPIPEEAQPSHLSLVKPGPHEEPGPEPDTGHDDEPDDEDADEDAEPGRLARLWGSATGQLGSLSGLGYTLGCLCSGSAVLSGRIVDWIADPEPPKKKPKGKRQQAQGEGWEVPRPLRRLALVAFAVYAVYQSSQQQGPMVVVVVSAAWSLAAFMNAPQRRDDDAPALEEEAQAQPQPQGEGEQEPEDEEPGEDPAQEEERQAAAAKSAEAVARAMKKIVEEESATTFYTDKRKGVHLTDLLARIQKRGALADWDATRLGEYLTAIGIPVRPQINIKRGGRQDNKPGIHYDDLTRVLGHSPRIPAHLVPDLTPTVPTLTTTNNTNTSTAPTT